MACIDMTYLLRAVASDEQASPYKIYDLLRLLALATVLRAAEQWSSQCGVMAACRRAVHGFRHAHLLFRGAGTAARIVRRTDGSRVLSSLQEEQRWTHKWSWYARILIRDLHVTGRREDETDYGRVGGAKVERDGVTTRVENEEARQLLQQVHLASLRKRLSDDVRDTIGYDELLHLCRTAGMASDDEEAKDLARVLNQAGVVLTFRDKVHLHPEKIAELVANVLPLSLLGEDDQRRMELLALMKKKDEIDRKAHKQMRVVLWSGLCILTVQVLVFFRLTFWELSWDVMEPIAFFATAGGLICGYTYFMFTSRDPSYQDFMQRIYHSRQRKLFAKQNFDIKRFRELQTQCQTGWKPLNKKLLEDCD